MRPGIALRPDYDAARLRGLAKAARDAGQSRRLLALAEIYDGGSRTKAARVGGVGPFSTISAKAWRWLSFSLQVFPGALPSIRPSGPRALNRTTQSRRVCSPTPPIRAARVREPPS